MVFWVTWPSFTTTSDRYSFITMSRVTGSIEMGPRGLLNFQPFRASNALSASILPLRVWTTYTMAAIVHVVQALKGKIEVDRALEALKGWKFNSPRGPIMIDPVTRDIVMNEYLSEAVMKDGRVVQKTIGKIDAVKDACKEQKIGPCAPTK